MSDNKKYYYLKLKENFFDSAEIKILESMPNGYKYSNLLLKLYLKSLRYEGMLRLNEYIPYNIDLRKGNFIALKDIFKDNVDYKMLINKEIENQIKEMRKNEKYIDKIYEFHGIKENQKFYLQDGKIVIFFDLYDIAPYAAGVPEFPITSKNIENQIELEYMTLIK